jgi:hypothetical protein
MDIDKTALLFGHYTVPPLRVGDHVSCLYRDADVVVYSWTIAPMPWPLCYRAGTRGAGKGILVEEELARAVRHEAATAIRHCWGVSEPTVCKWRRALGVGRMDAEGSRRLIHNAALGGLNARRKHAPHEVRLWTDEELAWLGRLADDEIAQRTGRTVKAVATMRRLLELEGVRQFENG